MGMFDTVVVKCPSCNNEVEFQSKAGDCYLDVFPIDVVPISIAIDLDHNTATCNKCKRVCTLRYRFNKYVTMEVE